MSKFDFSGPLLKVERAEHHINELEGILRRYVLENRKRLRPERQKRALKQRRVIEFAKPNKHTPTVLGDALHNLRVSLDHAYCILIEANGHTPTDFSRFPFGGNWNSIKGSIDGHINSGNGPSADVRDHIGAEIQPYPGGKHNLFDLHRLDIADKHQTLLPTSADAYIGDATIVDENGKPLAKIGSMTIRNSGGFIGGGMAIFENEMQNAFDVTFGKGQPFTGKPILSTLHSLRAATLGALEGLQQFL